MQPAVIHYLKTHGLTMDALEDWGVHVEDVEIGFPVFSYFGLPQVTQWRNFEVDKPKYIMRPERTRSNWSLYGIHRLPSLTTNERVFVVEGPADAIAVHSATGIHTLATLTADRSEVQKALLNKLDVIYWPDGDKAGDDWAKLLLESEDQVIQVKDEDPASTVTKYPNLTATIVNWCENVDFRHLIFTPGDSFPECVF